MNAIVGTLATSRVPRLQVRSLCADWGIGAEKLYHILNVLESIGVLRIIRTEKDTKAKTAGSKLFFSDPCYYSVYEGDLGTAREAFVALMVQESGWQIDTTKDDSTGDFCIQKSLDHTNMKYKIEVGGSSKKRKQADFVIRDDIDYPTTKAVPLWLLGMGW